MLSILSGRYKLRAATGNAPYAYARSDGEEACSQLYYSTILSYDTSLILGNAWYFMLIVVSAYLLFDGHALPLPMQGTADLLSAV